MSAAGSGTTAQGCARPWPLGFVRFRLRDPSPFARGHKTGHSLWSPRARPRLLGTSGRGSHGPRSGLAPRTRAPPLQFSRTARRSNQTTVLKARTESRGTGRELRGSR